MRVILKPMGIGVLFCALTSLTFLALRPLTVRPKIAGSVADPVVGRTTEGTPGASLSPVKPGSPKGSLLLAADPTQLAPFSVRMQGGSSERQGVEIPLPWSGNLWAEGATGEIFLSTDPVRGFKAIGLRNLTGVPSVQFYNYVKPKVTAGDTIRLDFDYLTTGNASGKVVLDDVMDGTINLPGTSGAWKHCTKTAVLSAEGEFIIHFQNFGAGPSAVLYLKDIRMEKFEKPEDRH